jgi:hypothetical protein
MIGINFVGRLGNQMFGYAMARSLMYARGNQDSFVFNFTDLDKHNSRSEGKENDSLQFFNLVNNSYHYGNLIFFMGSLWQKTLYLLYDIDTKFIYKVFRRNILSDTRWLQILYNNGIILTSHVDINHVWIENNIFIGGQHQNRKYFDHIRETLMKEFTPKCPPLECNKTLYEVINNTNSVCVAVRRGDFLDEENKRNFYVCDEKYFNDALGIIKKKIDNPTFIFFSNDIEWVKTKFKVNNAYYEPSLNPVWETFRMMYSCKHFIISNSTLHWWAQYLSRNPNKIVVSPDRWFANPSWESSLIQDTFIKVKTSDKISI